MRIALLNTQQVTTEWFQQNYPEVVVCAQADDNFWEAEYMILMSFYELGDQYYQIVNLWKRFLEVRHKRKKLIILGWVPHTSPNYIYWGKMPTSLKEWASQVQRVSKKPAYPSFPDRDILASLARILYSHGQRSFQRLLIRVQIPLRKVERAQKTGKTIEEIMGLEAMKDARRTMGRLGSVWEERLGYFSLMPQFQELLQFERIWKEWLLLCEGQILSEPRLSRQIATYLDEIITDITSFYKMDNLYERKYSGNR